MLTFSFECEVQAQLAALQQAAHFPAEMRRPAHTAPAGESLPAIGGHALGAGRQFLRDPPRAAAQQRVGRGEKKGARHGAARAPAPTGSRAGTAATW